MRSLELSPGGPFHGRGSRFYLHREGCQIHFGRSANHSAAHVEAAAVTGAPDDVVRVGQVHLAAPMRADRTEGGIGVSVDPGYDNGAAVVGQDDLDGTARFAQGGVIRIGQVDHDDCFIRFGRGIAVFQKQDQQNAVGGMLQRGQREIPAADLTARTRVITLCRNVGLSL